MSLTQLVEHDMWVIVNFLTLSLIPMNKKFSINFSILYILYKDIIVYMFVNI